MLTLFIGISFLSYSRPSAGVIAGVFKKDVQSVGPVLRFVVMKNIWMPFAVVAVVVGFTFSTLTSELRQEVAKYIIVGFLAATLIRPIGLTIGNFLRKLIKKD